MDLTFGRFGGRNEGGGGEGGLVCWGRGLKLRFEMREVDCDEVRWCGSMKCKELNNPVFVLYRLSLVIALHWMFLDSID